MLVMKTTHEAAVRQLQTQLAEANARAEKNYQAATYQERRNQELEIQSKASEAAQQQAEKVLRTAEKTLAVLRTNLAEMAGKSPFIRVGGELHLFTSIQKIKGNDKGIVDKINGQDCGYEVEISVADLERLVSARYHQAQSSDKE